jgi:amino acid permease
MKLKMISYEQVTFELDCLWQAFLSMVCLCAAITVASSVIALFTDWGAGNLVRASADGYMGMFAFLVAYTAAKLLPKEESSKQLY